MRRKTRKSNLNSDRKIEELYVEALKEVKEGKILFKVDERKTSNDDVEEKRNKKSRKRPEEMLEETIKKQQELRRQRGTLSVPVSRLVPFRNDTKGFHFPQDFRRDDTSLVWVPRSGTQSPCGISEYERLLWGECGSDGGLNTPCNTLIPEPDMDLTIEDTLHVLPLRAPEVVDEERAKTTAKPNLPPIYRRAEWRDTIQCAHEPSRSIPAKADTLHADNKPLVVGRQDVFSRENRAHHKTMSVAERRNKMRSKSLSRVQE